MTKPIFFKKRLSRRRFIVNGLRLSALAFVGVGFAGRNNLKTERLTLFFPNLPETFDRFTIVQISDLHASFWVRPGYLNQVVDRVNALEKDIVVVTGDLITGAVNDFWKRWMPGGSTDHVPAVAGTLRRLDSTPRLAVLGNHDQWDGKETERRLVDALSSSGIEVLRNRSVVLERGGARLFVAGTDDYWFTCNLGRALKAVPAGEFTILLSHNPDIRKVMGNDEIVDLTLCGHTHGGQVTVPYLTDLFLPIKNPARYMSGLVKESRGYTYVNRGIGTLVFPFRLGASPEITQITLKRG